MGARETDPVEIAILSGILLLGLPQDTRLARLGRTESQTLVARLREARSAFHDPAIAWPIRRLAARAQLQIPTGLGDTDALIDAVGGALVHRAIIGAFLARAPLGAPVTAPVPKPAPSAAPPFARMSAEQRIRLLLERTPKELAPDLAREFRGMVTVEALAGIAAAFVVLLAAQFIGVGEIADAALAWWAYCQAGFSGVAGLTEVLRAVVAAVRASDEGEFDQAVKRFAEGLTLVGVALLTVVVTRAAGKRAGGGEGGGGNTSSGFGRPQPEPIRQRWPIAPGAARSEPAVAAAAPATRLSQPGGLTATEGSQVVRADGTLTSPTHPLFKHGPDVTDVYLKGRVQSELVAKGRTGSRTAFNDRAQMEAAISKATEMRQSDITTWLATGPRAGVPRAFEASPGMGNLGRGFEVTTQGGPVVPITSPMPNVKLVLMPNGRGGYLIHTAHPF